ncbi:MAG: hypothetical protein DMG03_27365 [Acidobacteria bacterium]|nr:MAG: hypothetical protein DMG03_27365 [Acidobacteriota bacterium]
MAIIRRALPPLEIVARDVRYAVRGMRRTPAFSAAALSTLALAIGANTAIFSVVDQLLIRPLAYREAGRLVVIDATRDYEGTPRPGHVYWPLDAAERWQESLRAFSDVTFYTNQVFQLSTRDGAEILDGATVAPSFFSAVGGPILAGRPIGPADMLTPSIVISQRLAQRLFNGASAALGAHVVLNSTDYVVIGVAGPQWDVPSWKPPEARCHDRAGARRRRRRGAGARDGRLENLRPAAHDGDDAARQATRRRQAGAAAPLGRRGNRFDRRVREYREPARRA